MDIYQMLAFGLPPITSVVTWFVTRKQRNNAFLSDLQASIDLLSDRYNAALEELVKVKEQNVQLITNQNELKAQIQEMAKENNMLKDTVDELNKRLEGIKTITRTK